MIALALVAGLALGAENPYLSVGIRQLRELDETQALKTLDKARGWSGNTPQQLAQVHLYIGMTYAALVKETEQVQSFKKALVLDPDVKMPVWASPRVREVWVKLGGALDSAPQPESKISRLTKEDEVETKPPTEPRPAELKPPVIATPVAVPPAAAKPTERVADTPSSHGRGYLVPLIGALVFIGGGIAGQVVAQGNFTQLQGAAHLGVDEAKSLGQDGSLAQTLSWVAFSLAGACAVATIILIAVGGGSSQSAALLHLGPGSITAEVRF